MRKIALDCDGVLLAWYPNVCEKLGVPLIKTSSWNTSIVAAHWDRIANDPVFWENIPALTPPGHIPEFDCYITSIPDTWEGVRYNNLIKLGFPDRPLYISHNKVQTMKRLKITTLVDDKPSTIKAGLEAGLEMIQFYPYYAAWEKVPGALIIHDLRELNLL